MSTDHKLYPADHYAFLDHDELTQGSIMSLCVFRFIDDAIFEEFGVIQDRIEVLTQILDDAEPAVEIPFLTDIVKSLSAYFLNGGDPVAIWESAERFAFWLRDENRFNESFDVLRTIQGFCDFALPDVEGEIRLRTAGLAKRAGWHDMAELEYRRANRFALDHQDQKLEVLSMLGYGGLSKTQGKIAKADELVSGALALAESSEQHDIIPDVCHGLALLRRQQGEGPEAAQLAYRAFCGYESNVDKARALGDLGLIARSQGYYEFAGIAYRAVLTQPGLPATIVISTHNELLGLAVDRGERDDFLHWRTELEKSVELMRPLEKVDYYYKSGLGLHSVLECPNEGERLLSVAQTLASEFGLTQIKMDIDNELGRIQREREATDPPLPAELARIRQELLDLAAA